MIFVFHRGIFGSSKRSGEERGVDVQQREPVPHAGPVRTEFDPGDDQLTDERAAAAAAAVKR